MPTFLTTSKMSPELAARVQSSVSGRRVSGDPRMPRWSKGILRIGVVGTAGWMIYAFVDLKRRESRQLEHDRGALLQSLQTQTATFTPEDLKTNAQIDETLVQLSGAWPGDLDELKTKSALDDVTRRPSVWVRGPIDGFTTPAKIATTASASGKDAFLLCVIDPPASRTEKNVLGRVRIAYANGAQLEHATSNVRRLDSVKRGLPFLQPAFADGVRAAPDGIAIRALKKELDGASLDTARAAMRAEVVFAVMDEPAPAGGITEIDGERAHDVRVAIVDRKTSTILFRARKHVDPSDWTTQNRAQFASGLDGCALAYDLRDGLR